jgi:hypothetical protein
MSELNLLTMKDIEISFGKISKDTFNAFQPILLNYKLALKAEAIKDYKTFDKNHTEAIASQNIKLANMLSGKMEYIKWKNNLTEEDLK